MLSEDTGLPCTHQPTQDFSWLPGKLYVVGKTHSQDGEGGKKKKAETEAKREEYMLTIINSGTETCEGEEPFHTKKSHADKTGGLALKVKELSVTRRAVEQRWCAPVAQLCAMVDVWTCLRSREVFATQACNFYFSD